MKLADKEYIDVHFLVSKERVILPCISFITEESTRKGLMNVRKISKNIGAFFVFEKSGYNKAWMKNTFIPLDIIFVSEEGIIVEIVKAKEHDESSVGGNIPNKYMIEVFQGYCDKNNIRKGARIKVMKRNK
jgi:uncharacterized membrane protein (UPF0127 family)